MKVYRIILLLYIILITLSCSNKSPSTEENSIGFSVKIMLLKEYYVPDSIHIGYDYESLPKHINNKRYDVQISLENNSDTTINIVMMTCSWDENIIINTPYIKYVFEDCNSNYPHVVVIKAHEQYTMTATLEKSKYIDECETCPEYSKSVTLRLGLIYIPYSNNDKPLFREYFQIMEDKSLWKTIWSNPLDIDKQ